MSSMRLLVSLWLVVLLDGCGQSGPALPNEPGGQGAARQAGALSSVEITTPSGVYMVYVPGGEFLMGSNQGDTTRPRRIKSKSAPF